MLNLRFFFRVRALYAVKMLKICFFLRLKKQVRIFFGLLLLFVCFVFCFFLFRASLDGLERPLNYIFPAYLNPKFYFNNFIIVLFFQMHFYSLIIRSNYMLKKRKNTQQKSSKSNSEIQIRTNKLKRTPHPPKK